MMMITIAARNTYEPVYENNELVSYKTKKGDKVWFYVERDEDEPSESTLYRIRYDGKSQHHERLVANKWVSTNLFLSYLYDALLDEVTLKEAERIAEQIGEELVD
jgi:hypothetical protein